MEKDSIEEAANHILKTASYNSGWVNIIDIAIRYGFKIVNAIMSNRELEGFLIVDPVKESIFDIPTGRLIGVNAFDPPETKRFVIACQLGEYFLHYDADFNHELYAHRKCRHKSDSDTDYFAEKLLMPDTIFRKFFQSVRDDFNRERLIADYFQVPLEYAKRRIEEAGAE